MLSRFWDVVEVMDEEKVMRLSSDESKALYFLLYASHQKGYVPYHRLHPALDLLLMKNGRGIRVLGDLCQKGLVEIEKVDSERVHVIPEAVREVLWSSLSQEVSVPGNPLPARGGDQSLERTRDFLTRVVLLLTYARRHPIRLTRAGRIHRRQAEEIADLVGASGCDGYDGLTEALRFCWVARGLLCRRMLARRASLHALSITSEGEAWIMLPWQDQVRDMCKTWCESVLREDATFGWLPEVLKRLKPHSGTTVGLLASTFESRFVLDPAGKPIRGRIRSILNDFFRIGLLDEYYPPESPDPVFRLTELGRAVFTGRKIPDSFQWDDTFYVQADYQVIASRTLEPRVLSFLDAVADLEKADKMLIYRLNPRRVGEASEWGLSGEEILGFLGSHIKGELPQNVEFSIREWAGTASGRAHIPFPQEAKAFSLPRP
ncbi:MAG TPA: hypothetical protein GX506_03605 [Firmicutes bacterium]|nr:hypothetical protein [Bacillota bacterium]